jgi:hypothetical protein
MYSDLHNLQSGSSTKVEPGANICIITSRDRITLLQNYMRLSLAWRKWKNWACPDHTGEETCNVSA